MALSRLADPRVVAALSLAELSVAINLLERMRSLTVDSKLTRSAIQSVQRQAAALALSSDEGPRSTLGQGGAAPPAYLLCRALHSAFAGLLCRPELVDAKGQHMCRVQQPGERNVGAQHGVVSKA